MFIPEDKISEILNASDIVDIVSESVILKKSGQNFFGLCPFHSEKTPSFSVNPAKQIFHCFGCSAGGNSISYVMKYHGLSFPEAVKMLARRYNIVLEIGHLDPVKKRHLALKESLFRLNKKVMGFYENLLRQDRYGYHARQYLEKRNITQTTIDEFHLGYAMDQWEGVVGFLKNGKIGRQAALNSGLILPRKNQNGFYDRFRNRLMFPIFDINMQVAGFGGRVMDDSMPKYMNSPETPVYSKTRILYGLHAAKQHCRKTGTVHIVEGYFDFLSLFQNGIKNTVATLGTALTAEHVRVLKGYAPSMVLVFDSDAAGINAARRSIKTFMNEGVDTRILVLPRGEDPDTYVVNHGPDAFLGLVDQAKSVMQFLLQVSMDTHGLSVEGRIRILDDMKPFLAGIQDSALRSLHIRELAETLSIDEKAVLEKVKEQVTHGVSENGLAPDQQVDDQALTSDPREKQLLSLMLHCPDIISTVQQSEVLDCFYSQQLCHIGKIIAKADTGQKGFVNHVMAKMEKEGDKELVASLAMADELDGKTDLHNAAISIINRIIRIKKKKENILTAKIIRAEKGCDADVMELLKLKQQEIRQLHDSQ
ncbi:MAG: DNA primase [Desulfotignum sp.]|nr:DNA primase [Desulfotignum sp.]MCF8112340.1 DNA primase [Desulfotignum sp.]MCF8124622.1 DNA primase [Desulfotignum sp.]